jgi:hypothetical protein
MTPRIASMMQPQTGTRVVIQTWGGMLAAQRWCLVDRVQGR